MGVANRLLIRSGPEFVPLYRNRGSVPFTRTTHPAVTSCSGTSPFNCAGQSINSSSGSPILNSFSASSHYTVAAGFDGPAVGHLPEGGAI